MLYQKPWSMREEKRAKTSCLVHLLWYSYWISMTIFPKARQYTFEGIVVYWCFSTAAANHTFLLIVEVWKQWKCHYVSSTTSTLIIYSHCSKIALYVRLLPLFFIFVFTPVAAGQERFRTLTSSYYRGAQGIILGRPLNNSNNFPAKTFNYLLSIWIYSTFDRIVHLIPCCFWPTCGHNSIGGKQLCFILVQYISSAWCIVLELYFCHVCRFNNTIKPTPRVHHAW